MHEIVLACGDFAANNEMLTRCPGRNTHILPLIASGV